MSERYGICQICGREVKAYSREALHLTTESSKRVFPKRPLRAEPCGHEQPREVVWTNEARTYPPVRER